MTAFVSLWLRETFSESVLCTVWDELGSLVDELEGASSDDTESSEDSSIRGSMVVVAYF